MLTDVQERLAIEVRSGRQRESLPGVDAFLRSFGGRALLVGTGGMPIEEFLTGEIS